MVLNRFFLAISILILVSGCQTTIPPLSFTVPNVGISEKKIEAELRSVTVLPGRPDEVKGELNGVGAGMKELWQTSLVDALNRMVIFQDDASKKVNITVKILQAEIPRAGASMTSYTIAVYEITDRKNGDIIYTQEISSSGTVPFDYAFMGIIRMRESLNRAVQNNITMFLQSLEAVDINKPMFPAPVKSKK